MARRNRGIFRDDSPLEDHQYSAFVTCTLMRCDNSRERKVDEALASLGLPSLELFVEPSLASNDNSSVYKPPPIQYPVIAYLPERTQARLDIIIEETSKPRGLRGSIRRSIGAGAGGLAQVQEVVSSSEKMSVKFRAELRTRLNNCAVFDSSICSGELLSTLGTGGFVDDHCSFDEAIATLGGPEVLMPILQAASTSKQICYYFWLLKASLSAISNVKYLHRYGYRIIATLLMLKPVSILSVEVLNSIFNIVVHKNEARESSVPSILFTDSLCMYFLILNHQIWDSNRREYIETVIEMIGQLISDETYGLINTKRLSKIGIVRWISLLITRTCHGLKRGNNMFLSMFDSTTRVHDTAAAYLANYTPFLTRVFELLMYIVSVMDLRTRDLLLFSHIIVFAQQVLYL